MADRVVFRGAGGRFISRAAAEEAGGIVEIYNPASGDRAVYDAIEYLHPPEIETEDQRLFWSENETERGFLWDDFDENTPDSLGDFTPPAGADAYRVFVDVEGNPDYPRGMASTGWLSVGAWNPSLDMIKGVDGVGFNQIRFRRS
jgi:hypothetical protein